MDDDEKHHMDDGSLDSKLGPSIHVG